MTGREPAKENQSDESHEENSWQGREFRVSGDDVAEVIERAFDYRGDVTVRLNDDSVITGYIFDRKKDAQGRPETIRMIESSSGGRQTISVGNISEVAFSGRDTAAGKSWETWVRKYTQRLKQTGQTS